MTERDAFIRSIIANPDDDVPRLVYADWLDEHGEPERAEFIRVQCELARTDSPFHPEHSKRPWSRDALRLRERDLLFRGYYRWFVEDVSLPAVLPARRLEITSVADIGRRRFIYDPTVWPHKFHRGFVESITCSWDDWVAHADAIRAVTPLRKVRWIDRPPADMAIWHKIFIDELVDGRIVTRHTDYPGIEFEFAAPQPAPTVTATSLIETAVSQLAFSFRDIDQHLRTLPALNQVMRSNYTQQVTGPAEGMRHLGNRATIAQEQIVLARSGALVVRLIRATLSGLLRSMADAMDESLRQSGADPAETGIVYAQGCFPRFTVHEDQARRLTSIFADCTFKFASIEEVEAIRRSGPVYRPRRMAVIST